MYLEESAYLIDNFEPIHLSPNKVCAAHGSAIAKRPHKLNLAWRTKKNALVDELTLQLKAFLGKSRFHEKKYRSDISCVLANCMHGEQVIYSRNTRDKMPLTVIDWLTQKDFLFNSIGNQNEYEHVASWFTPTNNLKLELASYKIEVALANESPMLELRTKSKVEPYNWIKSTLPKRSTKLDTLSKPVKAFNTMMLDHKVTLDSRPQIPYLYRVFNHKLDLGGRFYGATHQGLPKKDRKRILIDDEEVCELDYRAIHWAILYAWIGKDLINDPYTLSGIDRNVAKKLMLRLINCEKISSFTRMVTLSGNPQNKKDYLNYTKQVDAWEQKKHSSKSERPKMKQSLEGFIEDIPDGLTGKEVLDAILEVHSSVSHFFGSQHLGLRLQFTDSEILAVVLLAASTSDVPVLPIHDSIICKVSDKNKVHSFMNDAYKSILSYEPVISCM